MSRTAPCSHSPLIISPSSPLPSKTMSPSSSSSSLTLNSPSINLDTDFDKPTISSSSSAHIQTQKNNRPSLFSLPLDVLRRILSFADVQTLCRLSETNTQLRDEVVDEKLWRYQAQRRFRVTPRVATSRRLQAAGHVSWRTLYANWHLQSRMPVSRFSGPAVNAFAKGCGGGAIVWFTVTSSDDCRVNQNTLRVRIIVQNISSNEIRVATNQIAVLIRNVGLVNVMMNETINKQVAGCSLRVIDQIFMTADGNRKGLDKLKKDDFVILFANIKVHGSEFEIDALERIVNVNVPVFSTSALSNNFDNTNHVEDVYAQTPISIKCAVSDRQIWDAYELLPGGWWARVG